MPLLGSRGAASTTGFGALANLGYFLRSSLRFRGSNNAYLSRTPSSAGNRRTFTWSGWVKRGTLGASQSLFHGFVSGGFNGTYIWFTSGDILQFYDLVSSTQMQLDTAAVFRDPSAWYHVVVSCDTTQAVAANRAAIYVNGVLQTLGTATYPSQNYQLGINNTTTQYIGTNTTDNTGLRSYFDGYLAEVNFIDGQALTPSSFGKTDSATGQWVPKKYSGTYGTNGFYLKFDDSSAVGKDSSGNSNGWSTSGHSVTPGATYDLMTDVPTLTNATTANYCVMNPLQQGTGVTLSGGNLNISTPGSSVSSKVLSTIGMTTGKWYCEMTINSSTFNYGNVGLGRFDTTFGTTSYLGNDTTSWCYAQDGNIYTNTAGTAYGNTYTAGDIIGIAFDADNGKLFFSKNGTFQNSGNPVSGTNAAVTSLTSGPYFFGQGASPSNVSVNFGQRSFAYTPPTGFKALNTFNLP